MIRRARREDLPTAEDLLAELDRLQGPWRIFRPRELSGEETLARFEAAIDDPDALPVVAEVDGLAVAIGLGSIHRPSSISDDRSLEITSFVVRPDHRGLGIGRAMVAVMVEFARGRGVDQLDLRVFAGNQEAAAFWSRLGFRPRMTQMVASVGEVRIEGPTQG